MRKHLYKRRAMNGNWTPGGGRNMYTKGLLNERDNNLFYVFLIAHDINNNDTDQYITLASKNTPLPISNTLVGIVIPQSKHKREETLFNFVQKTHFEGINIEKFVREYEVISNLK
mgnify:CR=1 FL=1